MKPIYVIINILLTLLAIIALWLSPAQLDDKWMLTALFLLIMALWISTLSMRWVKWVLGVKN